MRDLYEILGVARDADEKAVKSAYRKLAKQHHPDLNPGDAKAAQQFKEISAAYAILSDAEKRKAYDAGELDAEGNPIHHRQQQYYRDYADSPQGARYHRTHHSFDPEDISDLFSGFFHGGMGGRQAGFKRRDLDAHYQIRIDFLDAARGAQKHLTLPDGKVLDVHIPAGVEDGQKLRLKGQGASAGPGEAGDAYLELHILPHPYFLREGKNILLTLPVDLATAVLGGKLDVPTVHGPVRLSIPPNSSSGRVLRLKGKGIAGGDQKVTLSIQLPKEPDAALEAALRDWSEKHRYQPETAWEGKI